MFHNPLQEAVSWALGVSGLSARSPAEEMAPQPYQELEQSSGSLSLVVHGVAREGIQNVATPNSALVKQHSSNLQLQQLIAIH